MKTIKSCCGKPKKPIRPRGCGGKKKGCGSAFEWECKDFVTQVNALKKAA